MTYTLAEFSADCHAALERDSGPAGVEAVRRHLERAVGDADFVAAHLGPDNETPRTILYEDPALGFCIVAHVYLGAKQSSPHDHGPSWAIYGQAAGATEMTDWRLVTPPEGDSPGRVEAVRTYTLSPGMARAYNIGDLHSPKRDDTTRLIRIEGLNMDTVKRDKFEAV